METLCYFYHPDHPDHLGSTSWVTDSAKNGVQYCEYLPFGEPLVDQRSTTWSSRYTFSGKERDSETGYSYFGARYYHSDLSIWLSVDPLSDKYPNLTPYAYCANNPVRLVDPDGREPIKPQAGTIAGFVTFLNNTRTKMGTLSGASAHDAMLRLGKTELSFSNPRPMPATTGPFNNSNDKYIYTEKGGWIDMSHFMFYAGKAYAYKQQQIEAQDMVNSNTFIFLPPGSQIYFLNKSGMSPAGEAVQDGYYQEMSDRLFAPYSAYSYEDLPSNKYGADFGANYFVPNSKLTIGEQLQNYFNDKLGATLPQNAPNFNVLPNQEPTETPSRTNHTTTPVYTSSNP